MNDLDDLKVRAQEAIDDGNDYGVEISGPRLMQLIEEIERLRQENQNIVMSCMRIE